MEKEVDHLKMQENLLSISDLSSSSSDSQEFLDENGELYDSDDS